MHDAVRRNAAPVIPVRPPPPLSYPGWLRLLAMARKDLLGFWPASAYRDEFICARIFRRWIFIANSPDTVEHVLVTRSAKYLRKSPYMRKALEPLLGDGLFASDGDTWRSRRALLAPAFAGAHLRGYGAAMTACAEEARERWRGLRPGEPVAMLPQMACLTAEIIGRAMFGDALGTERAGRLVSAFSAYQDSIEQFDLGAWFGLPSWFPRTPQRRRAKEAAAGVHQVVEETLRRNQSGAARAALADALVRGPGGGTHAGLTFEQMRNEAVVIFMAGHETTANALAWAWYLLALHPAAQARLHEELDRVLGGRAATYDDLPALKFTRAVVEEALRLYPPVPLLSRECVADDEIRGRAVPKGSVMLVVPWLLHRHELLWERADEFLPERFMPEAPKRHVKFSYLPFSAGPRVCPGASFGDAEAVISLATLAASFSVRLPPGRAVRYECRLTLRPAQGLPLLVQARV
jgi:cytochrome P450